VRICLSASDTERNSKSLKKLHAGYNAGYNEKTRSSVSDLKSGLYLVTRHRQSVQKPGQIGAYGGTKETDDIDRL
jgi:hypothetical protein